MSSFLQDLRYSARMLTHSPGFAVVALLTLALGIGANTAIFSFVDGALLKPLPYENADRIVRVLEKPPQGGINGISTLNFLDWQRDNTVFDFMAAQTGGNVTLTGGSEPVQLRAARVSSHYFDIFGINAFMGRTFLPEEDQLGKDHVAILSHALWVTQFGADPSIINRKILLDNEPHTVIGVLPPGSAFDRAFNQLWRPLAFEPSNMTRNFHWFGSFARLKKGVSLEQARAQMNAVGARIEKDFPDSNKGWGVAVDRYADVIVGEQLRTALWVLMAATGLVLLIGCANLANLALARGVSREREIAVRASLGAGRWRLMCQFLTENVMLSVLGGLFGIIIGYGMMRWMQRLLPPFSLAREINITMDVRVLLFALGLSILTGLLFGMAPALQATSPDLVSSMKTSSRSMTSNASRKWFRDILIIAEVALAFILLAGSALMIRSFFRLLYVDPGLDPTNVLTLALPTAVKQFPDPARLNSYLREIQTAVEAVPGVRETALSCGTPMQGTCYGMPMQAANRPRVDVAKRDGGFYKIVTPSYFTTLRLQLVRGRLLSEHDTKNAPRVLVINERLAKRWFPNEDPIGQQILIQEIIPGQTQLGPDISWQIVGVVHNEKVGGMSDDRSAGVYVSNEQTPGYFMTLIIRSEVDPLPLQKAIAAAVHGVNKGQALADIRTLNQIKDQSMGDSRLASVLLGIFGILALLLSAIGIYGVISYSVAQRRQELGIRAALGASGSRLLGLVLKHGLILTAVGLAIGLGGALGLTRLMAALLYNLSARDPVTMVTVATVLVLVAAFACYVPARRATKVDPLVALRYE